VDFLLKKFDKNKTGVGVREIFRDPEVQDN